MALPPSAIRTESTIPITIPITYDTYSWLYLQGLLADYLGATICPKCSIDRPSHQPLPPLELTNSTVDRTLFPLKKDEYDIDTVVKDMVKIVLVKCPVCKSRCRLLPADILPYKLYSLPVIGLSVAFYNRGDLSLRGVAWDQFYGERTFEHTTLHGWTEGLGAWWLGQPLGEAAFSVPATRIRAELEIRYPQITSCLSKPIWINPRRYRSKGRMERLQACKQVEMMATIAAGNTPFQFVEFNRLIVRWGNSFGLGFKTGIRCTAFEHIDPKNVRGWGQILPKEPLSCPMTGRSPPFDTK